MCRCGAPELYGTGALSRNVGAVRLASYGRSGEGWFNNTCLMFGFRNKAHEQGGEDEVVGIGREGEGDFGYTASSIRSSGGADRRMAGLDIPVEPHYVGIALK
jgi:hypothetical protein